MSADRGQYPPPPDPLPRWGRPKTPPPEGDDCAPEAPEPWHGERPMIEWRKVAIPVGVLVLAGLISIISAWPEGSPPASVAAPSWPALPSLSVGEPSEQPRESSRRAAAFTPAPATDPEDWPYLDNLVPPDLSLSPTASPLPKPSRATSSPRSSTRPALPSRPVVGWPTFRPHPPAVAPRPAARSTSRPAAPKSRRTPEEHPRPRSRPRPRPAPPPASGATLNEAMHNRCDQLFSRSDFRNGACHAYIRQQTGQ
ncbi:hypothetical protein GCM10010156_77010 [Planobispora rosea]|uniref:Uncharacterized protein n=1 Tax=Planobispora rosea TaxID=35762 RepID=A0A8J3SAK6_PLARO|nr:hypothetical protein GCM10010156_77010 [Planobispora rosea]GIH89142.1 hypothetical protein Pro02_75500 [Planobispora rosea]